MRTLIPHASVGYPDWNTKSRAWSERFRDLSNMIALALAPSPAPAETLNVRNFGARGDGVSNDLPAIQAAIGAAQPGGIVYFPAGTYLVNATEGLQLTNRRDLALQGDGPLSIIKRSGGTSPIRTRLATATNCTGLIIQDLAFDANGIERYGGLNIYDSSQVRVQRCRAYDSRLKGTWVDYDHYWLVIQKSEDIWVTECQAEDVELIEADNDSRIHILDNVSRRAAGTCAIGWFAVENGYYAYDYEIARNRIVDPRRHGVVVALETKGPFYNTVQRVRIANNAIVHDRIAGSGRAIMVGYFSGGRSAGNVFEDVVVEDNEISSGVGIRRDGPEIYFMTTQEGSVFRRCHVRSNRITGTATPGSAGMDLRRLGDCEVVNNVVANVAGGIDLSRMQRTLLTGNRVTASKYAFGLSRSMGGNQIKGNLVLGTPAVAWDVSGLLSTDLFVP